MISDKLLNEFAAERIVFGCPSCQKLHGERRQLAHEIISLRNQMIQAARGSADIVDLAEENVKLMAQAAVMREALTISKEMFELLCKECEEPIQPTSLLAYNRTIEALSPDVGKNYHNPADVEALNLAKETILKLKPSCGNCNPENCEPACGNIETFEIIDEVLSAIENAIGGNTKCQSK